MNIISENWRKGKVAIINGVMESSGVIHLIAPGGQPRSLPLKLRIESICSDEILANASCTSVAVMDEISNSDLGIRVVVGECGMGADGFVAVEELNTKQLRWIAFFDFANPFQSVSIQDKFILATNNLNEEWQFAVERPWEIEIVAGSFRGR